jgi:hypothetical protein
MDVSQTPPRIAFWQGQPSGETFAELLRNRAARQGVAADVEVESLDLPGLFEVTVRWNAGQEIFEVGDWFDTARVYDDRGSSDVTVDEAVDYLSARLSGLTQEDAFQAVIPPRPSLWSRFGRRLRP